MVTEDVPEGATMVGLKARSTLIPAETWLREFIPYGTPCDEPCEPNGNGERVEALERHTREVLDAGSRRRGGGGLGGQRGAVLRQRRCSDG